MLGKMPTTASCCRAANVFRKYTTSCNSSSKASMSSTTWPGLSARREQGIFFYFRAHLVFLAIITFIHFIVTVDKDLMFSIHLSGRFHGFKIENLKPNRNWLYQFVCIECVIQLTCLMTTGLFGVGVCCRFAFLLQLSNLKRNNRIERQAFLLSYFAWAKTDRRADSEGRWTAYKGGQGKKEHVFGVFWWCVLYAYLIVCATHFFCVFVSPHPFTPLDTLPLYCSQTHSTTHLVKINSGLWFMTNSQVFFKITFASRRPWTIWVVLPFNSYQPPKVIFDLLTPSADRMTRMRATYAHRALGLFTGLVQTDDPER